MISLDFSGGDICCDKNGNIATVTGLERLRQKLLQRLRFFKGEWFLDVGRGVPYRQDILAAPANAGFAASVFNQEILKESEVTGIANVSADFNHTTRTLSYQVLVTTIHGDMELSI